MPADSRKFSRIRLKIDAELTAGNRSFWVEEIINLSLGGCLLPVSADFRAGTVCSVRILLNTAASEIGVDMAGEIKRCDSGTLAVQFTRTATASAFPAACCGVSEQI